MTNFDERHFRRVISKSRLANAPPTLARLLVEATNKFYDEFDYYPNIATCAPGTFTILGEYMELAEGFIVQGALPEMTLIVARLHGCHKCRLVTLSNEVDSPKRIIFPILQCRTLKRGVPKWANTLKGIVNLFRSKSKRSFDGLVHSSVPVARGFGSSAALHAAFYTLVECLGDGPPREECESRPSKCKRVELKFGDTCAGLYSNFTAFHADVRNVVVTDTGNDDVEMFSLRDPNVLFLLTIPDEDVLHHTGNLLRTRCTELNLAAKLLDLESIKDARECHLRVLASMDDPSRQKVTAIVREFECNEEFIAEFVEELFTLPKEESISLEPDYDWLGGEGYLQLPGYSPKGSWSALKGESDVEYRYNKICDEVICLGGLSDLSARSDLTVMSKLLRRVRYVVTENARVRFFANHVRNLDYASAGIEITRSHLSMKCDFDVSSPAMDAMVRFTAELEGGGVYGAKMMRNGAMLTLLNRNVAERVMESIVEKFGDGFAFRLVFPSRGAGKIDVLPPPVPKTLLSESYPTVEELKKKAVADFDATYQRMPTHGSCAPAIVNVLGDYADFNEGLSMPMALNLVTIAVGALNGSGKIRVATTSNFGECQKVIFSIPSVTPLAKGDIRWANYVKGAVQYFKGDVPGFDCLIESSIPVGSRISSSSALIVAVYRFLEELTGCATEDASERAGLCMRAEHEFTDTVCGIDDFVVAFKSVENRMMVVDTKNCRTMYLPFLDPSYVFVLVYSVIRTQPSKAFLYLRMEQCYDVARLLGMRTLRCAREEDLDGPRHIPETVRKRAKHIVSEGRRVYEAVEALRKYDAEKLGRLMVESHISLRDDFGISCEVLDSLVERAMEVEGVMGAKQTGHEFGSSVICLAKRWAVDDLVEYVSDYMDRELKFFVLTPSAGAEALDIESYVASLPGPKAAFEKIFAS